MKATPTAMNAIPPAIDLFIRSPLPRQRVPGGFFGVNLRRVEQRNAAIRRTQKHADLGAAEDDGLGSATSEVADDPRVLRPGRFENLAEAQFLVNYPVHCPAVLLRRHDDAQAAPLEPAAVEVLLHRKPGPEQADAAEARSRDAVGG